MVSQPSPAYIHTLTTAFASTLDEIPQDMCRHFADLRELDAVLSQSLSGITKRIDELTQRIEGGLASLSTLSAMAKGQAGKGEDESSPNPATEEEVIGMFQLLHEIADDTGRIKLGGEDKIRVASLAAEHMNAYHSHLLNLVRKMHNIDSAYAPEILSPHTLYPHVPPSALVDPAPENRRGAPRRTVAVQNNSYGLPYAPMSAQGQNGAYHSSHRNESTGRGVNGDTPSKRRRVQAPIASSSIHHSQLQGPRADGDMDTDGDNSTPRRGVSAQDAEAYRPGGNAASKGRTHGRKGRDGARVSQNPMVLDANGIPIPMDGNGSSRGGVEPGPSRLSGNGIQGAETGTTNHGQTNGVSSHKSQLQNGRSRGSSSQHHRTNPNPQPQHYPIHYQPYGERNHVPGNPFVDPSTGYGSMGPSSYPQSANLNPLMDAAAAAYHHHNSAMNMNPNLNHLPPSANYPNAMGMGMVIPTSLPPPPGTAHGRPSSANMPSRNSYDVPPPRSAGNPRHGGGGAYDGIGGSSVLNGNPPSKSNSTRVAESSTNREPAPEREYNVGGNGSSASGGLMPLPMLTSLPPAGVLTHPSHAPHPSYVDPALSRSRGYSSTQGYSANSYGPEPTQNPLPPVSHHPHTTYPASSHSPSLPSTHTSQPSYAGNSTSNPTAAVDKVTSKPDVHPSLVTSSSSKDPLPSVLHSRGPSVPSSAGGSSTAVHGSLATRDPPYWGDAVGNAERFEREVKSSVPSRARSSTVDGGTLATAASGNPSRFRDEPAEQRPVPAYERISPTVEQRDRDRENATLAGQASHQPSGPVPPTGGPGPSTYPTQSSLPPISGQGPLFGPSEKVDTTERFEDRDVTMADAATGSTKPPAMPDRSASERERERERQGAEADSSKGEIDSASRDGPEKAIKTPTRRKTGEEGPFPFDSSSSPFKFGEGASGEIIEGQTVDEDSKPYCICGRPSFGQMIGCDDSECEFEWFHLQCLGITGTPPQGEFVCPTCKTRRAKGSRRPQKKKSTVGGRGRGM